MESKVSQGLYGLFFKRLLEAKVKSRKEIIPFPALFEKLCRGFSIPKKQCWEILFLFRDFGFIEIVCGHGVRIIKEI